MESPQGLGSDTIYITFTSLKLTYPLHLLLTRWNPYGSRAEVGGEDAKRGSKHLPIPTRNPPFCNPAPLNPWWTPTLLRLHLKAYGPQIGGVLLRIGLRDDLDPCIPDPRKPVSSAKVGS